ncbi:Hypothetical predicted protein [Paramuricea clavata]|uniref:Uncharacterized protein n=1 Tax=Paramuricea clavata TaxID=317549 RepID=A0A7D9I6D6_PARCT|nr:Hypothetical predicted protein [Paramuricea clavata]
MCDTLYENMDNGQLSGVVFLDIRKAFDSIDHTILLQKMNDQFGIKNVELDWFKSYLTNREQACIVNGAMSSPKTIVCGVPQGSILGPLLFLIYINDLPECLEKTSPHLYADDTQISTSAKTIEELTENLNNDLKKVGEWLARNKLQQHPTKTKLMYIGSKHSPSTQSNDNEGEMHECKEFVAKEYVNLVYDNIDFGEEIAKQTHVTNGIITQIVCDQKQISSSNQTTLIKKTQRAVEMPTTDIVPYSIGVKKTPTFQSIELDPECLELTLVDDSKQTASKLDLAYILIKYIYVLQMKNKELPHVSRVGYLPVIDASPTEYSTINTMLTRSKEIADKLELKYAVLVFDEAVYAKAQQVRWKEETFFNRFVVRFGEFHTIMTYLSAMSKIFEDGGLKDVFIEPGIVSEGSIQGVLSGKHYNRSVSCHKIMYEALQRLRFQAFMDQMTEEDQEVMTSFIESMAGSFPEDKFLSDDIESPLMQQILESYELFIAESSSKSRTFAFWTMYIEMAGNYAEKLYIY